MDAGPKKMRPEFCYTVSHKAYSSLANSARCYENSLDIYYGPQCDLYRRGAGFYAVLFGCLSAGLLLLIVLVIITVVLHRGRGRLWYVLGSDLV